MNYTSKALIFILFFVGTLHNSNSSGNEPQASQASTQANVEAPKYTVSVIDQNERPVKNAVVSFASKIPVTVSESPKIMDQVDVQFDPEVLIVSEGQTVIFPNSDNTRHHVYSFSKAKPFEIKLYSAKTTESVTFDTEGLVVLGCNIHDSMVGYIYVVNDKSASLTNKSGVAEFNQAIPNTVSIWHKGLSTKRTRVEEIALTKNNDGVLQASINIKREKKRSNKFRYRAK